MTVDTERVGSSHVFWTVKSEIVYKVSKCRVRKIFNLHLGPGMCVNTAVHKLSKNLRATSEF